MSEHAVSKFNLNIFDAFKFRVEKYPYKIIEVQLNSRMRERNYIDIANIIHSLLKDIKDRIVIDSKGIVYRKCQPVSFEIYYNGNTPTFNFAVNELDSLYFKNRLQTILPNSTLTIKDDYINDFIGSKMYKYKYDKHFMCSIKSSASPIESLIAIKKDINKDEKVLLQTIINPIEENWKYEVYDNWKKIKKGRDVLNQNGWFVNICDGLNSIILEILEILDDILEVKTKSDDKEMHDNRNDLVIKNYSSESRQKTNYDGFKVNIRGLISSKDTLQCNNISKSIETCYKEIEEDNGLVLDKKSVIVSEKNIRRDMNIMERFKCKTIMNSNEIASLLKLPDNVNQRRLGLNTINVNQIDVPKVMQKGKIKLGSLTYHGEERNIYMPSSRDLSCLPLWGLTKQGGGKTSELLNIANDTIKAKDGLVVFDYIRDLQLSESLIKLYGDRVKVIKLSDREEDLENLHTFSFPEIQILDTDTVMQKKVKAGMIATEIKYMLNAMAKDTEEMSRIMSSYLISACKVVFVNKEQTLNDVLNVLEDKSIRDKYIKRVISEGIFDENSREVKTLRELDEKNSSNRIMGLLDRFSIITENTLFNAMLERGYRDKEHVNVFSNGKSKVEVLEGEINNINFVDIMDKKIPIVIQLPQNIFTNKIDKDTICTYYMSRIRLAMSLRKDFNNVCRVIIDEPHQIPKTMSLMADTIAEPRKFGIQYIMALHSFSQLDKDIRDIMFDIGCHFMLLKGVTEKTFDELKKNGIINDEFEYQDIVDMDYKFGALYLFNIDNKYEGFIGGLCEPLKDSNGKVLIG